MSDIFKLVDLLQQKLQITSKKSKIFFISLSATKMHQDLNLSRFENSNHLQQPFNQQQSKYSNINLDNFEKQSEDNLFDRLHRQIKNYQQKIFTQIWLSLQDQYKNKEIEKCQNKQMKKISDIYLQAYKKIHDLDAQLHKKYHQQHKMKLAEYYIEQKSEKQQQQQLINKYIQVSEQKIKQLQSFNQKLNQFFISFAKCLELLYKRSEHILQEQKIKMQSQIFKTKINQIQKLKQQYYNNVKKIYQKIQENQQKRKNQCKKLEDNLKELQKKTHKQKEKFQKLCDEEQQLYSQINRLSRLNAERQLRQHQEIQMNKQQKYKTNIFKKQFSSQQKLEQNISSKLYIRPQSQIIFDSKFINPQNMENSNKQIKQNPLLSKQNNFIIKGRYQTSLKKQANNNILLIVMLIVLTVLVVGVY